MPHHFRKTPSSRREARLTASWLVTGLTIATEIKYSRRTTHLLPCKPSHHHRRAPGNAALAGKMCSIDKAAPRDCSRRGHGTGSEVPMQEQQLTAVDGLCHCGCGQKTPLAARNRANRGHIKGRPLPFIHGHNRRHSDSYKVEDCGYTTPCWIWQGTITNQGYPVRRVKDQNGGKTQRMHRAYYERANGPIPDDLPLDHLCRVRACINPEHLEPVPSVENIRRGERAIGWTP